MPKLSLFLLSVLLLAACSKVNDMHDATMQMNKTTSELSATSGEMKKVMSEIYDSGRQGAALDLRNKIFEQLLASPKLEDKGSYATYFFLAFEFQLWSNVGMDGNRGQRERLMEDAAEEFNRRLLGITHWVELDPFAGKNILAFGDAENERASFNALAGALEKNNRKQDFAVEETGSQELSMLSMIETALPLCKRSREGSVRMADYPAYIDVLCQREELHTRLLRARYQLMGLAVLGQLTPMTRNLREGFKYKILGTKWDLDLSKLNESQLKLATYRLREAQKAHDFLSRELGVEESLDPSIAKIFSHATVVVGAQDRVGSLAEAQSDFLGALEAYAGLAPKTTQLKK